MRGGYSGGCNRAPVLLWQADQPTLSRFDIEHCAMTTNVSLTPELERFAKDQVASGDYGSVSEVVRDALRILKTRRDAKAAFMASYTAARSPADRSGSAGSQKIRPSTWAMT